MRLRKSCTCVHTNITSKRIERESPCWSGFKAYSSRILYERTRVKNPDDCHDVMKSPTNLNYRPTDNDPTLDETNGPTVRRELRRGKSCGAKRRAQPITAAHSLSF